MLQSQYIGKYGVILAHGCSIMNFMYIGNNWWGMAGFGKYIYIAGTELAGQSQGFYDHTSCNTLERVITCITCITWYNTLL